MVSMLTAGLLALAPTLQEPSLKVGDPAPPIQVAEWIKGEPIAAFEAGKVYLVEFWATWCGPCVAGMPHLSELEARYSSQGFAVIGVTSEDANNPLERVKDMAADKGDTMGYRVAWDDGRKTYNAYMKAAGQRGIPCCFLVDKQGRIAYIGHPAWVDSAVAGVIAGTWDPETGRARLEQTKKELNRIARLEDSDEALKAIERFAEENPAFEGLIEDMRYELLLRAGRMEDAARRGERLYEKAARFKDAVKLNALAWRLVAPDAELVSPPLDLALRAAQKANELTEGRDPSILDTLARVHFVRGDASQAVEVQKRAVEASNAGMRPELERTLREYERAAG